MPQESDTVPERISSLLMVDRLEQPLDKYARDEIKDFAPKIIRGIGPHFAAVLKRKASVETIEDLANLDTTSVEIDVSRKLLEKWNISAAIITKYSKSSEIPISARRVCIAGLAAAGKSSLVLTLKNQESTPVNVPTVGASVENISFLGLEMAIWDLGGQETFRGMYLDSPKQYLSLAHLLIYVVDSQKQELAIESAKYLDDLLVKFNYLKEKPKIYIVMHKFDPKADQGYLQVSSEYILKKIRRTLRKHNKKEHKLIYTSIFNVKGLVKKFARIFADISPVSDILTDSLAYYAEIHGIHACFLLTSNGFIVSEWTERLTRERRDEIFLEVMEEIRKESYETEDKNYHIQSKSQMGGIHILIDRIEFDNVSLFLSSISTDPQSTEKIDRTQMYKEISPWIKNFFSIIQ